MSDLLVVVLPLLGVELVLDRVLVLEVILTPPLAAISVSAVIRGFFFVFGI